jgi:tryptophan synthase alpha chain
LVNTSFHKRLPRRNHLFIPFIMAGDPNSEITIDLALSLQKSGASILELGIPYSDPLADGPVIQRASIRALRNGMTLENGMKLVKKMRKNGLKIPVILFTYYNPVLQLGEERFFSLAKENEIDGLLIPDLPFEESKQIRVRCLLEGLQYISLVAPTSEQRIEMIASEAEGFLYCVSSLGVTGIRKELPNDLLHFLQKVKSFSKVPIAVGFGISHPTQIQTLLSHCNGVIIGSAIIAKIEQMSEDLKNPALYELAMDEFQQYIQSMISPILIERCQL